MSPEKTISICDSINGFSISMHARISMLKEQILSLPDNSGLKVILLAQLDKMQMAFKEVDSSNHFIVHQVRRHQNSAA
jgi:hypothetical protein